MSTTDQWATHQTSLILSNTESLYHPARALAKHDPSGAQLGDWFGSWFRGDLSHLSGTDGQLITWLRDNMSEMEFRGIDWADIADTLASE